MYSISPASSDCFTPLGMSVSLRCPAADSTAADEAAASFRVRSTSIQWAFFALVEPSGFLRFRTLQFSARWEIIWIG